MGDVFESGEGLAGGRYRIDGLLGSGGMAQVYRAYDRSLSRPVAVKTMRPDLGFDAGFAARFRREAQAMAALGHPNVVTVHDTGEEPQDDGPPVPYFVMELVEGASLADRLRGGALPPADAVSIAGQVLSALAASHAHKLVHRDIKPANVLLTDHGVAKVADFGIVRAADGAGTVLTGTRMMVGTPQYMSPEQVQGSKYLDGRSDLYAVGVLMFEMLTGHPPFDGDDPFAVAYRHATETPPTLASQGVQGHPHLQSVLDRALAKRPEDRFPDAESMRRALEAPVRPARPGSHRSAMAIGGICVAGLLVTGVALALQNDGSPETKPSPSASAPSPKPVASGQVTVQLDSASESSWISVKDSAGRPVFDGVLNAGETKTFTDPQRINLVLGNAGAVQLTVNGRRIQGAFQPGQVERLTYTKDS
ncbi:RodZ domain-containing protein [Streptomyces sp. NPDC046876]|uniref:RodZ domain-containing protein n=1 Tax=Streptomyces sp. NPDC046876 TaxID=3155616 RepID=UPI0034095919